MITREDDVDAHALHRRGWTISAIARHLGHDRKTIRAYLQGGRVAGERRRAEPDAFESFVGYCRERLGEDPHLWATTLFDELLELGYDRSYPTFTRQLRARGLRPACEPCRPARGRPVAVIEHPRGEGVPAVGDPHVAELGQGQQQPPGGGPGQPGRHRHLAQRHRRVPGVEAGEHVEAPGQRLHEVGTASSTGHAHLTLVPAVGARP